MQQQYREKSFKKSTKLSSHLFVTEQNNDVLMKIHENRPTGYAPFIEAEVNDVYAHHARRGKGHSPGRDDQERNLVPGVDYSSNEKHHQKEKGKDEKR